MIYAMTTSVLMEHQALWESVHRLRHRIFVDEMGWEDIRRPDGLEIDQFDHDEAVHMLCMRGDELAGYQRMLPTTRPHLLSEILPELCEGDRPAGPEIYELTRYAVAPHYRDGRRGVSTVGSELIAGFVEWGLEFGCNQVIIEFEPMWVLRALQLRFLARPLGYQCQMGRQNVVATLLTFNEETLAAVRRKRDHCEPVFAGYAPAPALRIAS